MHSQGYCIVFIIFYFKYYLLCLQLKSYKTSHLNWNVLLHPAPEANLEILQLLGVP